MELLSILCALLVITQRGTQAASLLGAEHYYKILSVGDAEKAEDGEAMEIMYLRSDYNPYSVQEVASSISVSCYVEAGHIDGDVFTATCPPGCDGFANRLWGSGVYTVDSCFCAAAIHDGIISAERGGAVTIRKIEGRSSYKGNTRNGVTSKEYGEASTSFIFQNAGKARRPTYEISCIVQANWIRETDFNVVCPSGCGVLRDRLWGDETYSDESYICSSAIHDGKIKDSTGGEVHVIKTGLMASFKGSTRNDQRSMPSKTARESFTMEKLGEKSTSLLEVSCYFRADHVEEEVFTAHCPPGCDDISDQVFGTGIYTQDSFLCASAIHAGKIHGPMGGMVTVFKTDGNFQFIGSLENGVNSKNSEDEDTSSFIFQESSIRQPAIITASCFIRGEHLLDDVSTVICPVNCDHSQYEVWGTDIYKSDSYICAAAAHAGLIDVSLGGPVTVKRVPGLQSYEGTTRQRIITTSFGKSPTAFAFADNIQNVGSVLAVTCDFTAEMVNDEMFSLKCPAGCGTVSSKVWGDGVYTSDSPLCTAAIHDGFLKGSLGGKITVHKVKAKVTHGAATRNGIQSFEGSWTSASVIFQRPCVEGEPIYPVTCETRANFMVDEAFTVVCPPGCDGESNEVWGTGVYTDDSYVCGAAIHDGRLNADIGGQITVGKVPGLRSYVGTKQNGVSSVTKGQWRKSIIFQDTLLEHMSTFTVTCDVEGNMILDEEYTVICPPGCEEENERVWGTDVYTEDSFICASAIHAGKILAQNGGRVTVQTTEATVFESTTRNEITSKPFDKSAKSFRFI